MEPIMRLQQELLEFSNPNHDDRGRFTDSAGKSAGQIVKGIKTEGGATVDPKTGQSVRTGFSVGGVLKARKIPVGDFSTKEGVDKARAGIRSWILDTAEKGVFDHPQFKAGAWYNSRTKNIEIEPAEHISNQDKASKLGRERHQEGVQDLTKIGEAGYISTEGSGHFVPSASPLQKTSVVISQTKAIPIPIYTPKG